VRDEFEDLSDSELLQLWTRVMSDLRDREVIRSSNNPVGDYCELLVAAHFGVTPIGGSNKGYDLIRSRHVRVQVKGRRVTPSQRVGHWSVMHQLVEHGFDEIVAVVLNDDFSVREAWTMPWETANRLKRWNEANQGYVLPYTKAFLRDPDVTALDLNLPD
jgi:hypothetical protein